MATNATLTLRLRDLNIVELRRLANRFTESSEKAVSAADKNTLISILSRAGSSHRGLQRELKVCEVPGIP